MNPKHLLLLAVALLYVSEAQAQTRIGRSGRSSRSAATSQAGTGASFSSPGARVAAVSATAGAGDSSQVAGTAGSGIAGGNSIGGTGSVMAASVKQSAPSASSSSSGSGGGGGGGGGGSSSSSSNQQQTNNSSPNCPAGTTAVATGNAFQPWRCDAVQQTRTFQPRTGGIEATEVTPRTTTRFDSNVYIP